MYVTPKLPYEDRTMKRQKRDRLERAQS
ncbi:ribosome modulation factor, partial [Vibrio cholerae]|nr:ribosome modulation factor [Vibrio cholerae]